MRHPESGFTLIELVIVIVILGILTAFALPRFADIGSDARIASLEGAAGAMESAASITRSTCLVRDACDETLGSGESVDLDGDTINVEFGYPAATATTTTPGGIAAASNLDNDDYSVSVDSGNVVVTLPDTAAGECDVTYPAPTGSSAPDITINETGC